MTQKTLLKTLAILALSLPLTGFAQSALEEVDSQDKLVRIRPANSSTSSTPSSEMAVQLVTEKSSYRVDEAIHFKVKSDRPIFLYLFNVDARSGQALSILPNRLQNNREIKYAGDNQWHLVPNPGLEFFSDRPGVERIIMVASERYLDVGKLKSFSASKSVGDFFEMDNPLDAFDSLINEAYNDDEAVQEKRIGIRQSSSRLPRGVVVKEVNLRIR